MGNHSLQNPNGTAKGSLRFFRLSVAIKLAAQCIVTFSQFLAIARGLRRFCDKFFLQIHGLKNGLAHLVSRRVLLPEEIAEIIEARRQFLAEVWAGGELGLQLRLNLQRGPVTLLCRFRVAQFFVDFAQTPPRPACLEAYLRVVALLLGEALVELQRIAQKIAANGFHVGNATQAFETDARQQLVHGRTSFFQVCDGPAPLRLCLFPIALGNIALFLKPKVGNAHDQENSQQRDGSNQRQNGQCRPAPGPFLGPLENRCRPCLNGLAGQIAAHISANPCALA